ncbi:MAG: hypothetical protein K2H12_04530, partial [Acetatifactor sp.]|nr:hypothetical protein [Acetatifactor sp.]
VHPEPGSNSHVKSFFLPVVIWHYCLLVRSLKIEFSGLHCCLFVKEHLLLLPTFGFQRQLL